MSKKLGTYLVTFTDGTQIVCGNNYKSWCTHAAEYALYKFRDDAPHVNLLQSVEFGNTPFIDDGGLKYATPKAYQEVIGTLAYWGRRPS